MKISETEVDESMLPYITAAKEMGWRVERMGKKFHLLSPTETLKGSVSTLARGTERAVWHEGFAGRYIKVAGLPPYWARHYAEKVKGTR